MRANGSVIRSMILTASLGTLAAGPAKALTFNFSTIPGDSLTTSEANAFNTAAAAWSAILTDNFTVNIKIGFTSLGTNILGQTSVGWTTRSSAVVAGLLAADAKSIDDANAVSSLITMPSTTIAVISAQAKALGLNFSGTDGTIEYSTNFTFSDQRNPDGTIAGGTYDLIGIAEHEIAHVLGFDSSLDGGTSGVETILDEFRFAGAGVRSLTAGAAAYFSIDDGASAIASFSQGGPNYYQASHWLQSTGGIMDPTFSPGVVRSITPLDVRALDIIGYDVATTVPEPAGIAVIAIGLLGVACTRRRSAK